MQYFCFSASHKEKQQKASHFSRIATKGRKEEIIYFNNIIVLLQGSYALLTNSVAKESTAVDEYNKKKNNFFI